MTKTRDLANLGSGFKQAGASAEQRTIESKLQDVVSVLDFIPPGTDTATTDCTGYIQAALSASNSILIPAGSFALSGTILVGSSEVITLEGTLTRLGASTSPLVRFNGARSTLKGGGTISTSTASPNGLVLLGTEDPTIPGGQGNILWNQIRNINISGRFSAGSGDCGIRFNSEEGYVTSQANYFNWVSDVYISQVDYGVWLNAQCNGQVIHGVQMYRIGVNCINMDGTAAGAVGQTITDCLISNITVHSSGSLQNIIYVEAANRNSFVNIGGEPGSGRLYNFQSGTGANFLCGYNNCPNSPINLATTNVVSSNGGLTAGTLTGTTVTGTTVTGTTFTPSNLYVNKPSGSSTDSGANLVTSGRSEIDNVTRFRRTSSGSSDMSFTISFANPSPTGFYYPIAVEIFVAYTGNSAPRGGALILISGSLFSGSIGSITSTVTAGGGSSIAAPTIATSGLDLTITLDTFSSSTHRGVADVRVISWGGITNVS